METYWYSQLFLQVINIFNCKTLYHKQNVDNVLATATGKVLSNSPWRHLSTSSLVPKTDNCVILILDNEGDFLESIPFLNSTRLNVSVAAIVSNTSISETSLINSERLGLDLLMLKASYDNTMGGSDEFRLLSPYNKLGKTKKRHIVVSHLFNPPYITKAGLSPKGSDIDIVESLSSRLDFAITYMEGGSFDTVISHVASGLADMCISHLGIVWHRYRMGLAPIVLGPSFLRFAQRHAVPINSLYTISYPFTTHVWAALAVTVIAISLFLGFLNWYATCVSITVVVPHVLCDITGGTSLAK